MEEITWSNINMKKGEAAARGTQIKRLLGIKDKSSISAEQLKNMKDNFTELIGEDKTLQFFLDSITDYKDAAEWLSIHAFSLSACLNLLNYDFLKHPWGAKGF